MQSLMKMATLGLAMFISTCLTVIVEYLAENRSTGILIMIVLAFVIEYLLKGESGAIVQKGMITATVIYHLVHLSLGLQPVVMAASLAGISILLIVVGTCLESVVQSPTQR